MVGIVEFCTSYNEQNYQNTQFVKSLCENCLCGTRELYFNSLTVVDPLSKKIKVRKLTNTWYFSFVLKIKVSKSKEELSS